MGKKIFASMAVLITLTLLPSIVNAIAVDLGPFSFRLGGNVYVNTPEFRFYNDPICRAIQQHKLIVMLVQEDNMTKQVVLEPYIFGYDDSKQLVLQGYRVDAIDMANTESNKGNGEGFFGGVFSIFQGDQWTDVNFNKVIDIWVSENSEFKVRENVLENINKENKVVEPLCIIQL